MAATESEIVVLLQQLVDGSEDAAAELVRRFASPVRRVIRRHLNARVRPAIDSLDIAQQVWGSFFGRELYRQHLDEPENLLAFLISIARHKAQNATRNLLRQKRDSRRETPLVEANDDESLQASQPAADERAEREEEWLAVLEEMPEDYRAILTRLRAGHSFRQVANELGCSTRTVGRAVTKMRECCEKWQKLMMERLL